MAYLFDTHTELQVPHHYIAKTDRGYILCNGIFLLPENMIAFYGPYSYMYKTLSGCKASATKAKKRSMFLIEPSIAIYHYNPRDRVYTFVYQF